MFKKIKNPRYFLEKPVPGVHCVRMKGLEPPRLSAPDPKSGAAANYATSANINNNPKVWQAGLPEFCPRRKGPHSLAFSLALRQIQKERKFRDISGIKNNFRLFK